MNCAGSAESFLPVDEWDRSLWEHNFDHMYRSDGHYSEVE